MRGKLFTFVLVVLFCAATVNASTGATSGTGPLLPKVVPGVNATSNVVVNATLDPAFILSGTISGDPASAPSGVTAVSGSGNFPGAVDFTTHTYRIVLPAGTYTLSVTFSRTSGSQFTSFTYTDSTVPTPFTVSADTIRNITLPTVTTSAVTGTVSGLNSLFPSRSLVLSSSSISGFTSVIASSTLDTSGNYAAQLPNGTFTVGLSQSETSLTTLSTSTLSTINLGMVTVSGTTAKNFTAPTVTTANLTGTLSITGGTAIPSGSFLSGADVSGGTPPATISSGSSSIGFAAGAYGFIFQTGRTYGLTPSFPVQLLPMPAPAGAFAPPDPSPALLTGDVVRNVTYPALPGPSTGFTISGRLTITGTVTPVANASVAVIGSQITGAANTSWFGGTTTDAFGNYSITVPAGMNYTVSFQGSYVTSGDFDGDAKADYAVWRDSNGTWYVIHSGNPTNFLVQQWGVSGDMPVRGDFDGDGKIDFAVWRPSNGTWYVIPSSNPSNFLVQQWGLSGDIPVPGDYDGDGITDFAVFRPSNGTWYVIPSSNPSTVIVQQWGMSGDVPVPGDYDGDGKTDFAVWRPSNGTWYVIPSKTPNNFLVQQWGLSGDKPVPGDYDGDGKTDFAVWRPSSGTWYVIRSSNPSNFLVQQWGTSTDIPVPVDYDRDRKTDFAVWRPSNGTWYVIPSSTPTMFAVTQWGVSTDVPIQKPIGQ